MPSFEIILHQTHHTVADFDSIGDDFIKKLQTFDGHQEKKTLQIFPELFLCGYPLGDLCLQASFIKRYLALLERINQVSLALAPTDQHIYLIGGLDYHFGEKHPPSSIANALFELRPGKPLKVVYRKQLLPNYDIFDEKKYFTEGKETVIAQYHGKNVGLMICEDMWPSSQYAIDPAERLGAMAKEKLGRPLDLVVNLSASPFDLFKQEKRLQRASEIAQELIAPFVYVNRVGLEDEILFDGQSFAANAFGEVCVQGPSFSAKTISISYEDLLEARSQSLTPSKTNLNKTTEGLFTPALIQTAAGVRHRELDHDKAILAVKALGFAFQDYAKKCGMNKFSIALSGGIDSALVVALVKLSLQEGQTMEAIYMPGLFNGSLSYDLSLQLCKNLQVPLYVMPIKFLHKACQNSFKENFQQPLENLADENIQSRLRGMLLYTRSNQINSMVLNTSNKSEIAVGYSTQYGDSVGALSLLGDLYKTEVFALCHAINKEYGKNKGDIIPEKIITRPPSAELRAGQEDSQSLPPYERLDAILEGMISYAHTADDLVAMGLPKEEVLKTFTLVQRAEYKRRQFCPIVKLKTKSFGFGYRVPICKTPSY